MSNIRRHSIAVVKPKICRRPPPPCPPLPPPINELILFAYAAWVEPGSPGEANASGAFQLWPDPAANTWIGYSDGTDVQLKVDLELDPDAGTANVDVLLLAHAIVQDSFSFIDLPLQTTPWIRVGFARGQLPLGRGHVDIEIGNAPPPRRLQQGHHLT